MINQNTYTQTTRDWQTETTVTPPVHRDIAYAQLRVTLGLVFLAAGVGKFMAGVGGFAAGLQQEFAGKLPAFMVTPFAYALPFLEVTVGALLVMGLFNKFGLTLAGLLMMALTFGKIIEGDPATVAHNLSYAIIIFMLLWLADHNRFSVDRLLQSRPINE
jgi:thiosulfate dehydrogenase [quinone] large subunit